jgi:hypothetical protein
MNLLIRPMTTGAIHRSKVVDKVGSTVIGRNDDGSSLGPFLKIGLTLPIFHCSGNYLFLNRVLPNPDLSFGGIMLVRGRSLKSRMLGKQMTVHLLPEPL